MSILLTLEGIDGSGKSTLASELTNLMNKDPAFTRWVYQTKEPGVATVMNGIQFNRPGPDLRSLVLNDSSLQPIERELLFYVDASKHKQFIENQGNALVVSDRGFWSHLAYLRGYLKTSQIDWDQYSLCRELLRTLCAQPDAVIYLQGDLELMKQRTVSKQKDLIESNSDAFFEAVLDTYNDLVQTWQSNKKNILLLNARDSITQNVTSVINWLKGVFNEQELREGNRIVC